MPCFQAWARLCKCLGQDFLPYMGFVMPPLLQSAQLKPDVTITSTDSDTEFDEDDDRCPFSYCYWIWCHCHNWLISMAWHDLIFNFFFISFLWVVLPCIWASINICLYFKKKFILSIWDNVSYICFFYLFIFVWLSLSILPCIRSFILVYRHAFLVKYFLGFKELFSA